MDARKRAYAGNPEPPARALEVWVPAFAGTNGCGNRDGLAAAFLLARDEVEQQSVRRKAGQRRRHAVGKTRNDHAAALFEAAVAVSRHLLGRALENARKSVGGEARARL